MKRLIVMLAAAGLALSAGIAYASIPDSGGVIHGCYANKDGSLRVIDTGSGGACDSRQETPLLLVRRAPELHRSRRLVRQGRRTGRPSRRDVHRHGKRARRG